MHTATSSTPTSAVAVELENVIKTYGRGPSTVRALDGVSLRLPAGSFTAIMGPSGSGKSTLMHMAAGLDRPTAGRVSLAGFALEARTEDQLTELRRQHAAFVFQSFNLLPTLTVTQNVELPMILRGEPVDHGAVDEAIRRVGLEERRDHRPSELSGGQQQRVAIARSVASRATVLFADEPTGALDVSTAASILRLLREAVSQRGQAVLMTTHDPVAASYADTVLLVVDGRIAAHLSSPTAQQVAELLAGVAARREVA